MTTTIDFDALEFAQGPRVVILPSTQIGVSGSGGSFADFSVFAGLHVAAEARLVHSGPGQASLTLTIEHSDDGLSWTTAATFGFGPDGMQRTKVSAPKAHWRVSWAPAIGSVWQIVAVTLVPSYLDAAGGSLSLPLDLGPGLFQIDANGHVQSTPDTDGIFGLSGGPTSYAMTATTTSAGLFGATGDGLAIFGQGPNFAVILSPKAGGDVEIDDFNGNAIVKVLDSGGAGMGSLGFYNTAPVAQQTGVAVTAAAIHAALVNLGLITA